jgi:cell division protein FtsZ
MPKISPEIETFARIKVVGPGGSGNNAISHMVSNKVRGVDFIAVNTDAQALHHCLAPKKIHIGKNLTRGLGTGMNPELGKKAAEETTEEISEALKGSDMVFITCGVGGGTGTGAAPIVASIAKEQGILTIGVVTKPFFFEGAQRMRVAETGLEELRKVVDALIVIPNDRLLSIIEKDTSFLSAFAMCDDILRRAVEGISDLITSPGIINLDFADIKSVMENAGSALIGIGSGVGENRAVEAARDAINSPLLDVSIEGARGVLFAVAGGEDMTMHEAQEAAKVVTESIDKDARVIFGAIRDDKLKKNELRVTVIAAGFPDGIMKKSLFNEENNGTNTKSGILGGILDNTEKPEKVEKKKPEIEKKKVIYNNLEKPQVRKIETPQVKKSVPDIENTNEDEDWSSIPAFLRRKK